MSEETMLDRVSKILAEEVSRLMGARVKADDFGTRPIAREVLREIAAWLDEKASNGLGDEGPGALMGAADDLLK